MKEFMIVKTICHYKGILVCNIDLVINTKEVENVLFEHYYPHLGVFLVHLELMSPYCFGFS